MITSRFPRRIPKGSRNFRRNWVITVWLERPEASVESIQGTSWTLLGAIKWVSRRIDEYVSRGLLTPEQANIAFEMFGSGYNLDKLIYEANLFTLGKSYNEHIGEGVHVAIESWKTAMARHA